MYFFSDTLFKIFICYSNKLVSTNENYTTGQGFTRGLKWCIIGIESRNL